MRPATGFNSPATATDKAQKNAGLTNGRVGTITAIDVDGDGTPRVTVALDTAKGAKPQSVSFTVGEDGKAGEFDSFKHGYAGTIYRAKAARSTRLMSAIRRMWRSSAAYVALTRHREGVQIFAARETVKDLDAMAQGLARRTTNARRPPTIDRKRRSARRA